MAISRDEVERLARMAGVALEPNEAAEVAEQLRPVLDRVGRLLRVDAGLAGPWSGVAPHAAPLREDVVAFDPLTLPPEALAPAWRDSLFLVPRAPALGPDAPDSPEDTGG